MRATTIDFPEDHEQILLRMIKPHDDVYVRQLLRQIAWRVKARQLTVERFVEIILDETAKMLKSSGYNMLLREGLKSRINEAISDLITDRDLAEDAKDHFREKIITEL